MPAIVSIVDGARFLVDLDLSYSQMTPIALLNLTSHLAENRQLKRVSLAWNFLTTATKKIEHFEDLTP